MVNIGVCMYVFSMLELYACVLGSVRNGRRNMAMIGGNGQGLLESMRWGPQSFQALVLDIPLKLSFHFNSVLPQIE